MLNFILYGNDNTSIRCHISFLLHLVVWNFGAIDIAMRIVDQDVNVVFLLDGTFQFSFYLVGRAFFFKGNFN
jgi:hypothetical protein